MCVADTERETRRKNNLSATACPGKHVDKYRFCFCATSSQRCWGQKVTLQGSGARLQSRDKDEKKDGWEMLNNPRESCAYAKNRRGIWTQTTKWIPVSPKASKVLYSAWTLILNMVNPLDISQTLAFVHKDKQHNCMHISILALQRISSLI